MGRTTIDNADRDATAASRHAHRVRGERTEVRVLSFQIDGEAASHCWRRSARGYMLGAAARVFGPKIAHRITKGEKLSEFIFLIEF